MDYQTSIHYIHALPRLAKDGTLNRITALLDAMGNPQQDQAYIHVTGTNGKGSVANAISHILEASGLTVGLFTSPFIMRFNERLRIDHQNIEDDRLAELTTHGAQVLQDLQTQQPGFVVTEFEFITALALTYFKSEQVDVAVIEVGIGGREDSTNVIMPKVSVITSVGFDHQALLGNTLTSIAGHKAGIIKAGVPVVTGILPDEAQVVVANRVREMHSDWQQYGEDFAAKHPSTFDWGMHFDYYSQHDRIRQLTMPLVGSYQPANMAVAITAAKAYAQEMGWPLSDHEITKGVKASTWPGRMEKISDQPLIILDGAHNPQGIHGLVKTLDGLFGQQELTVIAGVLKDKAVEAMIEALSGRDHRLWLVPVPDTPRATKAGDYPDTVTHFDSWQEALAAYTQEQSEEPLIITGSLYLVSAVRQALLGSDDD